MAMPTGDSKTKFEAVQDPFPTSKSPAVEESLLLSWSPPEAPPEPCPHCYLGRNYHHLVIAVLILIIVFLAALLAGTELHGRPSSAGEYVKDGEALPPCGDDWIWYRNKCYYFSESEGNWTEAEESCAALNSSLAMIDTQKELDFLMRSKGCSDHWIGLWKDSNRQWKWSNGTDFNNWFQVADQGDYAYLNHYNVKSGDLYNTRNWVCSKEPMFERKF